MPTELIRGDVFFWQSLQAAAILVAVPIAFLIRAVQVRLLAAGTGDLRGDPGT